MSAAPLTQPDTNWWSTSRRRVFYDSHTPDFADPHQRGNATGPFPLLGAVNPERDLQVMADAGVDSVVLFAKCQYGNSYHPTEIGRHHSALQGRDLFGEALTAAHARGIRVIAYFSNMWDVVAASTHPEWALQPSPARPATGRWPALCLLSGYREYALEQVREIAQKYPIDALWSDILTAGPCVCARCQSDFRDVYGRTMPAGRNDSSWIDLIEHSQRVSYDYLEEQRGVLKAERPEAALIPNYYGTTFVDPVTGLSTKHLSLADIGSSEGYTDWHGLGFPSFAASYIQAGMLGRPSEVLVSRFVHTWDFTLRSEAQLRFEAFTVAAHGSTVSVDDQPYPSGAIEPEVYRRLRPVFQRIAEREQWLDGTPVPFAALYLSESARRLESLLGGAENPSVGEQSAQFPPSETRSSRSDLDAAVAGTYRALVESHIPTQFVDERPSSLAGLGRFKVVILPDILSLAEDEVSAITAFVNAGGGLVVTGECGVVDSRGEALTPLREDIRRLLGLEFGQLGGRPYPYLTLGPELAAAVGSWPLPHYGRLTPLDLDDVGHTVLANRTEPVLSTDSDTFWHNNQPGPGESTDEPVIVEWTLGKGRVIISSPRLGNNHARLGHSAYRELLAALVLRAAGSAPPVSLEGAHPNTELILSQKGSDLIAHLVTGAPVARLDVFGAVQPASVESVASIAQLQLKVPETVVSARQVVNGGEVELEIRSGFVELRDLDDWGTLVLGMGDRATR